MDLTYCKSQRRRARTLLRNYIVANRSFLVEELELDLPESQEIKQMSSNCFSAWVMKNLNTFLNKRNQKTLYCEFFDLLEDFICCDNNVTIAESVISLD